MKLLLQLIGLTSLFFLISSSSSASQGHTHGHNAFATKSWKMLVTVEADDFMGTMKTLNDMDIDIAGVDVKAKLVDALASDKDYQKIKDAGLRFSVQEVRGVTRGPDEEYKNSEEVETFLREYSEKYPDLTKLVSIGKSIEGRDIWALKISDNAEKTELDEPAHLFNSMHHAREVMGPEVGFDIVSRLLDNYGSDEKITKHVDQNEIWVMPMFNVDGNNKMWGEDSWWRKNVRGGYGVDLNRNYPSGWDSCNGSSGWRNSQTYRGESPASEPETVAMMKFIEEVRPVFDISYHSYSELVIYPFGCRPKKTQTKEVVEKIGKQVANLLDYVPGTAWETLYNADGGDIDWMYEAYQVIPFVIELNSRSEGFHPDYYKWRDVTVERNRAGWEYLLDRAHESGVRGVFTKDGKAVSEYMLNVYKVDGSQKTLFQNYVGHKTGAFHIVVNPGEYELEFNAGDVKTTKTVTVGERLIQMEIAL